MALDFPASPALNQVFLAPNGASWRWDGAKWVSSPQATPADITVADAPPALVAGKLWWDSVGGQLYVGYDDGVGAPQWVAATNLASFSATAGANNVGRNLIHNPLFNISQRTGPFSVNGYTVDRWQLLTALDTVTLDTAAANDTMRAGIGDEAVTRILSATVTGNAAAGSYTEIIQKIENVRRLAGKTVILSFWAASSVNGYKVGLGGYQFYGTGSPSGGDPFPPVTGASVTLTQAWARYSVSFNIPTSAGKTLGAGGDDATVLQIWFSSGATNNQAAGNIGVQSGLVQLWGIQLEIAQPGQTQPTPLEKPDPQQDLAKCQRFYCTGQVFMAGLAASPFGVRATFPAFMRSSAPVLAFTPLANVNMGAITIAADGVDGAIVYGNATTASIATQIRGTYTASADL